MDNNANTTEPKTESQNNGTKSTASASQGIPAEYADNPNITWYGGHYSGKAFRLHFVLLILLTCAAYYLGMRYGIGLYKTLGMLYFWLTVQAIPILLWLRYFVMYWYYTTTITYELRANSIISRRGFFHETQDKLLILRINDVRLERTLWDRLFFGGIGTVVILSSDPSDPTLKLSCLEDPKKAFDTISYIQSDLANKRGFMTFGSVAGDIGSGEGGEG